jgi:hypothetical protein
MQIKTRVLSALLSLFSPVLLPGAAVAQDRCATSLIQDKGRLDLREASSLAMAELYRQSRSRDSNWAAGITVPIGGVPVTGSAQSAERTRENFFSQSSLQWNTERVESVATQTLSKNAVEVYRICKDGEHRSGPRILVYDATAEGATVEIRWHSSAGAPPTATDASIVIEGGELAPPFPMTWQTGEARTSFLRRESGQDIRIFANIGLQTASTFLSRLPEVPSTQPVLIMASCMGRGDFTNFRLWGPQGESCNGLPGRPWGSYTDNPRPVTQLGSCVGPGGSVEGLTFWGPVGQACLQPPWGEFQNPVDISATGIANCVGNGRYWAGHYNWGPAGSPCFGLPAWGNYDLGRVVTNALN